MARTSNPETPDQTPATEQTADPATAPDVQAEPGRTPAVSAPSPSPRSKRRVIAPKPRVEGDVVLYAGTRYPMADAVELGLVPPRS